MSKFIYSTQPYLITDKCTPPMCFSRRPTLDTALISRLFEHFEIQEKGPEVESSARQYTCTWFSEVKFKVLLIFPGICIKS